MQFRGVLGVFALFVTVAVALVGQGHVASAAAGNRYAPVSHDLEPGEFRSLSIGVFGPDERQAVTVTSSAPYSMVVLLLTEWGNGHVTSCSGFMAGPRTVGTSGHCVYNAANGGWARRVLAVPGANGATRPFGVFSAASVQTVTGWVQGSETASDFGAVTLSEDVGNRTGTFGMRAETDANLRAGSYSIAGYPGDKTAETMWRSAGGLDAMDAELLAFRMDVAPGSSGSPIWTDTPAGPVVVGIVEGGTDQTNVAVRTSQPVVQRFAEWAAAAARASATATPIAARAQEPGAAVPAPPAPAPAAASPAPAALAPPPAAGGTILGGSVPASGGYGLIVFGGGSSAQLVAASGCPVSSAAFWVTENGAFLTYVPGTGISAVNAAWESRFAAGISAGTPLLARCR